MFDKIFIFIEAIMFQLFKIKFFINLLVLFKNN